MGKANQMEMKRTTKTLCISAFLITSMIMSGCASSDLNLDEDPDLLTDTDEIPERPGLIEGLTGKKLEKTW